MQSHKNFLLVALVVALGCGQEGSDPAKNTASEAPSAIPASSAGSSKMLALATGTDDLAEDEGVPPEKFSEGARSFQKVKDALLATYYSDAVSEDDLYRAATAGMLERLDPKMKKWNKLLSPREMVEVQNDLKGEVVGIGAIIKFDRTSGYVNVTGTIPGSAAARAGLVGGDTIVRVNDKLYKGMKLRDVIGDIRGKAGESVTLSVLRDGKIQPISITRELVTYDQPSTAMFPGNVGYMRIPSFTEKTTALVKSGLDDLAKKGAASLVVDMRQNPGGLFEEAIHVAELFVPPGADIVTLKKRGKPEEKFTSKGTPILGNVPLVVLVDGATASGAEFISGALHDSRHARIVGSRTLGKWSVQDIEDLPNGYAYKYTLSLLYAPNGKTYDGIGLEPDVEVSIDEAAQMKAAALPTPEARLAVDAQLHTAVEISKR